MIQNKSETCKDLLAMGKSVVHSTCYCQICFLKYSADTSDMGRLSPLFYRGVRLIQYVNSFQSRASFQTKTVLCNGNISLNEGVAILNMKPNPVN